MSNDPVNTLAQLILWRLEIDVIGTVLGWALVAVLVIAYAVFGISVAHTLEALVAAAAAALVYAVIARLIRGPQPTEAEVLYQRSIDIASGRTPRA